MYRLSDLTLQFLTRVVIGFSAPITRPCSSVVRHPTPLPSREYGRCWIWTLCSSRTCRTVKPGISRCLAAWTSTQFLAAVSPGSRFVHGIVVWVPVTTLSRASVWEDTANRLYFKRGGGICLGVPLTGR